MFIIAAFRRYAGWFSRPILLLALICLSFSSSIVHTGAAAAALTVEYQIKASLVFNFMPFVTWPEESFSEESSPYLVVCLIGEDVYGSALQRLAGEIAHGKTIAIEKFPDPSADDWKDVCQVAIFAGQSGNAIQKGLSAVADKPVLTIGESAEFLQQGGIIRFTIVDNTVRFEINLSSAKQARLIISSKLLRLASAVLETEPGGN